MAKFHEYLISLSIVKYTFFAVLMCLIANYVAAFISVFVFYRIGIWDPSTYVPITEMDLFDTIGAVTFGPIIESYLSCVFPIGIMLKFRFFEKRIPLVIFISSFGFSLAHLHIGLNVVLYGFLMGIILAYTYIIYLKKIKRPVIIITIIHSAANLISMIIAYIRLNI